MRIALTLEYDGREFHGWQRQPGLRTVQGRVETALAAIAGHPVALTCAGRTDAGVHATGQVAHFDTTAERPGRAWVLGVNSLLPDDVAVRAATPVADDFHARFSALRRAYLYRVVNPRTRPVLGRATAWWVRRSLDPEAMAAAARVLLGEHDFSSFRAAACQAANPVRTLYRADVTDRGETFEIRVEANAFLHHMVRNIVGALVEVGSGQRSAAWVTELLAIRDRRAGAVTAPAHGLAFVNVYYPPRYGAVG